MGWYLKLEYDVEKISSKIAKKNAIRKIMKKIVCTLLLIVAIINAILLYYNLKGEETPNVFGLYFFNIISRKYGTNITKE